MYTLYIDVILICFLLSFLVFKFLVFKNLALFYFHFKKVYINGNIARILVNLAPYGIYKIKPIKWGVIYVFSLLLADFNCCMGFCFMFLLVVFIVIIFNFLIRFTLYNLRAFSPLFYIINHSLIRFIFYLGMFKLLLINSFSETDYLFSGFSYISQDIILVTVKNLIIFVFIYFNLFDPNLGYIFASVLPGSYYFFYRNILLYYKNLCSTIVYNGCLMDCGFMSVFKCRFVYNYQFSRFSNRVIAIHRDLDSYINWGNSPNILNKINTSNSYFKNFYVCNPLNQNNFIVESRCNFLNGFYNRGRIVCGIKFFSISYFKNNTRKYKGVVEDSDFGISNLEDLEGIDVDSDFGGGDIMSNTSISLGSERDQSSIDGYIKNIDYTKNLDDSLVKENKMGNVTNKPEKGLPVSLSTYLFKIKEIINKYDDKTLAQKHIERN